MKAVALPFSEAGSPCGPGGSGGGSCLGPGPGTGYCTLGQYSDLPMPGPEQDKCPAYSTDAPTGGMPIPCPMVKIPA